MPEAIGIRKHGGSITIRHPAPAGLVYNRDEIYPTLAAPTPPAS